MDSLNYTCPRCGRTSHNVNDVRERYCGHCHQWEDITVRAVEYAVNALPATLQDHYEASTWTIRVCWRGPGDRWAVMWMSECYDAQGNHQYESNPSSRTDEFKRLFRFGLEEATEIAKALAPKVSVNGHTAEAFAKGLEDGTWR